jgi:hypothetical protein
LRFVVAYRPASSPALASSNEPVHTAANQRADGATSASRAGSTPRWACAHEPSGAWFSQPPPGTTTPSGEPSAAGMRNVTPRMLTTSPGSSATNPTSRPALDSTSNGPKASISSNPSNTTISIRMPQRSHARRTRLVLSRP